VGSRRAVLGDEYQLFTLPHGEWIRLLGRCGLVVEDLIEVQVPPGTSNSDFPRAARRMGPALARRRGLVRPPPCRWA
jgi:hypothetical protein